MSDFYISALWVRQLIYLKYNNNADDDVKPVFKCRILSQFSHVGLEVSNVAVGQVFL